MKKKILVLCLVVAMLATAVVSGSLAWFTDTDEVTNTFTVGSVKIEQNEVFETNSPLLPIVKVDSPSEDPNYVEKIVTVENTGKNAAYVRTFIAIPKALEGKLHLDLANVTGPNAKWQKESGSQRAWEDGVEYVVYCYVYMSELDSGAETPELLKGVYLDASVDIQENPRTQKMEFCWKQNGRWVFSGIVVAVDKDVEPTKVNVLVATQAVQADGFNTSFNQLENAKKALDAAFGRVNQPSALPFSVE